ncbi:hypothetical protein BLNAU_6800 [Blattamonas nauphoetae]|uniref:TmcB/TmcC TPR repeats domain-containing protein n=1 Tax=Blattamonas nauphoetae TaxID=2049346 RepID=A0ABQ9Y3P2_9EUKA|nr:hypothetical protein BLNAU_6800 [Blattamonas nauphoetae]
MPLPLTSDRPKQHVESVIALTEDNMKDAVNHIVIDPPQNRRFCGDTIKSIKHPRQVQELFAFLQVKEIAKDQFTLRMVDQSFRKLIVKPRFGVSTKVRMTYALFLAHHLNSQYRMAAQIQKLCDFFPNLTERWICYIKTKEMEKKVSLVSEQAKPTNIQKLQELKLQNPKMKLDQSNLVVSDEDALSALDSFSNTSEDSSTSSKTYLLKFQLDQAQKLVKIAQGHLAMMWMHLGRRNVDCEKVQEHAIKTLQAEKEATTIYLQQLKEHPSNSTVLRQFALLLRDLTNDEETSSILLQEADKIEDDTGNFTISDWNEEAFDNDFTDDEVSHHTNPSSSFRSTHKEQPLNDVSGSNQIEVLIKNFPNTNTIHIKSSILIYMFVVSALLVVLAITIVSFTVSHADFVAYESESKLIREGLFISTSGEDLAFFFTTMHHLSSFVADPDNPSSDLERLYVQKMEKTMDDSEEAFNTYNQFVQPFFRGSSTDQLNIPTIVYSIPSKMSGGELQERSEELMTLRQLLYRAVEPSEAFLGSVKQIYTDRDEFEKTLLEVHMNFHLPLLEEVKDLSSKTMDSISQRAVVGGTVQMVLLLLTTLVLFVCAALPICLKIRTVNKLGREQLRILCSVSTQSATAQQTRMEKVLNQADNQLTYTDNDVDSIFKNDEDVVVGETDADLKEQEAREQHVAERLEETGSIVPKSIVASLTIGIILFLVISYSVFIFSFVGIVSIPEISRLIILSGYRRSYFNLLIGFDILRLKPTEFRLSDPQNQTLLFETTKYSTVILNNLSLLLPVLGFLYGSVPDTLTGDEFYDNLNTRGARGRFREINMINTRQDSCFIEDRTKCDEEGRLGDFDGEFSGLLEVISKVLIGSVQLTFDDTFSTKYEDQDVTFLINLTRQDIQDSLRQIDTILQDEQGSLTTLYQTALVIMIVAVSLAELVLALIFFIPLPTRLNKIEVLAGQLSRLAKSTEKKSLEWS